MKVAGNALILFHLTFQHADEIIQSEHGHILPLVSCVLEGDYGLAAKEQALAILVNAADAKTGKMHIMKNDDLLYKIRDYIVITCTHAFV